MTEAYSFVKDAPKSGKTGRVPVQVSWLEVLLGMGDRQMVLPIQ